MKLLIVDDEIRAVQALVKRVNWQEYDFEPPLAAYSMAQAQGVFQQQEIYLMLCDIEMPQGSGLELFEWVKTYYPLTECIFVTCHDEYSYESAVHHAPVQKRNGLFYSAVHHIPKDCTCGAVFGRYEPADYRGGASLRV